MQNVLQNYLINMKKLFQLYINYAIRYNPVALIKGQIISSLREFLQSKKRKKMVQYRLNSLIYKTKRMEQIIAQSNEHLFLQGRKVNELR